jgi:hypothetical protein
VIADLLALLETALVGAGYRVDRGERPDGVLGEDATRIVWAVAFRGISALLEGWEAEQAWLVETAAARVSRDKSWELYLVLTCGPQADEFEAQAIEGIRRDVSYARKLVVPGAAEMSPSRMQDRLAALQDLTLEATSQPSDALTLLEERARTNGMGDAVTVLDAHRANRPLFGDL